MINAYLENSIEKSIDVFTYGEEISENILKNSKVELFKVDKKLKKFLITVMVNILELQKNQIY